ncbi:hypothetical protein [Microbacterium lacus]|uniref:hypothetical protein n=1 Tax=Microbacterium lacus TaxID=415217 RepID=UPI000C2C935C|nr:hypothetical protein [Microbacterium lacus]
MPRLARTRRAGVAAVGIAIAALALSSCADPEPDHGGVRGEPTLTGQALVVTGIDETTDPLGPAVRAWYSDGTLVVTTLGSGSCPGVPSIEEIGDDTVILSVVSNSEGPCTADLGPTTFELPVDQDLAGYTVDVTFPG